MELGENCFRFEWGYNRICSARLSSTLLASSSADVNIGGTHAWGNWDLVRPIIRLIEPPDDDKLWKKTEVDRIVALLASCVNMDIDMGISGNPGVINPSQRSLHTYERSYEIRQLGQNKLGSHFWKYFSWMARIKKTFL